MCRDSSQPKLSVNTIPSRGKPRITKPLERRTGSWPNKKSPPPLAELREDAPAKTAIVSRFCESRRHQQPARPPVSLITSHFTPVSISCRKPLPIPHPPPSSSNPFPITLLFINRPLISIIFSPPLNSSPFRAPSYSASARVSCTTLFVRASDVFLVRRPRANPVFPKPSLEGNPPLNSITEPPATE